MLFGYFVVLPDRPQVADGVRRRQSSTSSCAPADYIGFVTLFLLAFGVVFELPVFMLLLAALHVVSAKLLRKQRRIAVVVIAVVAMVATPSQDPVSMLLMMAPLLVLYEFSIVLTRLMERRSARREQLSPA